MAERTLVQLTSALLGDFDLVIADALTLSGGGILPMLRRQVGEKGLGLVIRVDSAGGGGIGVRAGGGVKKEPGVRGVFRGSKGKNQGGGRCEGGGREEVSN